LASLAKTYKELRLLHFAGEVHFALDHEAREQARKLGIERFEMSSGLNDAPTFIAALAELVIAALDVDRAHAPDVNYLVAAD